MDEEKIPEQQADENTEAEKPRSPFIRALALLGAAAVLVLSYVIFRYGHLLKL